MRLPVSEHADAVILSRQFCHATTLRKLTVQGDHGSTPGTAFAVALGCRISPQLIAFHIPDIPISTVVYITKDDEFSPFAALVLISISEAPGLLVEGHVTRIDYTRRCTSVHYLQFRYSAKAFSSILKLWHSHNCQNSSKVVLHCPNVVRLEVTEEGRMARILVKGKKSILNTDPGTDHGADHSIAFVRILVKFVKLEPMKEFSRVGAGHALADVAGLIGF